MISNVVKILSLSKTQNSSQQNLKTIQKKRELSWIWFQRSLFWNNRRCAQLVKGLVEKYIKQLELQRKPHRTQINA